MKRQLFDSKSGFTLFELMVVIAIFGIFIYATSIFTYSPQTEGEKADRMTVGVSGILKTSLQNISIGRMPNRDGNIAGVIRMSVSTGGLRTNYYTGTNSTVSIKTENFVVPFFDSDPKYEIKSVTWTGSSTVLNGMIGSGEIIIDSLGVTFSGAGITGSGYALVEIRVGYLTRSRKIILDRRTGKITETKIN